MLRAFESRYVKPKPGLALVVGSRLYAGRPDRRKLYAEAVGVDMQAGEGVNAVFNLEEGVAPGGPFSHADCISVLEHSRRPWLLAANLERSLEVGGTLFVTVPFAWRVHAYPSDYWRFTASGLRALFSGVAWQRIEYANAKAIAEDGKIEGAEIDGWKYLPRTEVYGFGVRR